mgnify:CR=1 FL=1
MNEGAQGRRSPASQQSSIATKTLSSACSEGSRTSDASESATTGEPTCSSQPYAMLRPSASGYEPRGRGPD